MLKCLSRIVTHVCTTTLSLSHKPRRFLLLVWTTSCVSVSVFAPPTTPLSLSILTADSRARCQTTTRTSSCPFSRPFALLLELVHTRARYGICRCLVLNRAGVMYTFHLLLCQDVGGDGVGQQCHWPSEFTHLVFLFVLQFERSTPKA